MHQPDLALDPQPAGTARGYLSRLAGQQWRSIGLAAVYGVAWTLVQAIFPWALGRAVDHGLERHSPAGLGIWAVVLAALALAQAGAGVLRHRMASFNWLQAAMRTQALVARHAAEHGRAITKDLSTGEVMTTVGMDATRIGRVFDVTGRFVGSIVAYVVVGVLVLRIDLVSGLVIVVLSPLLLAAQTILIRPLQRRELVARTAESRLNALGADTAAGLRVLRGTGGEAGFVARYAERSDEVRQTSIRSARIQALLGSGQLLAPGILTAVLTWTAARQAVAGQITAGQLVTLYGYAAFLLQPLATTTEMISAAVQATICAERVRQVLRRRVSTPASTVSSLPGPDAVLEDPKTGLRLHPGEFTALVCADDATADSTAIGTALARRLTALDEDGSTASPARWGEVPVTGIPPDLLRGRVLAAGAEPYLFSGALRDTVDPWGTADDETVLAALATADASDLLDLLPGGLDGEINDRARSLSGGQRQRVALARAVLAEPEILVLVEPTSAVDAHTEARIAARLRAARQGRTTLVATSSPPLLAVADRVAFASDGRIVAVGTHLDLLELPGYRATVIREGNA